MSDILSNFKEHLEWLDEMEGKFSNNYIEELLPKRQNKIDYVGSSEFIKSYNIIYNWVKNHEVLYDTDIHYKHNPGIELENEEWNKFTDSIAEKFNGEEIIDNKCNFHKYHYEYGALNIYFMHGQGTICWITYNKENDREIKLNKIL